MKIDQDWWRGAVIYQIYPRSFFDSNGDGVGDLPGVTAKLDYIADLGVDAIWLSPFFTSPMKDAGYDVANYRDVDPIFGTLRDFDKLAEKANALGLKIVIDQVISHSSDQHPWFIESRSGRDNSKADWYVWADPKPDGCPPTNWLSVFGGSAWTWNGTRRQYYYHNFLAAQPDLNFHNPEVIDQVLGDLEFWLQRGVNGFRVDAVNHCFHDKQLRDNPANQAAVDGTTGIRADNPYAYQRHKYDKTQPENLKFLVKLRQLIDKYPGATTVGEIGDDNPLKTMAAYTSGGDKLHMAYSFDFLTDNCDSDFIRNKVESIEAGMPDGWPCWAMGNHDVPRVMTRWADDESTQQRARMYMAMLLTQRGSICLYQGEELGYTESVLTFEDLVDPYGIAFWPQFKGRDGCRTPLAWDTDQPHGGFSSAKPWLPVYADHIKNAVSRQVQNDSSMLHCYQQFLNWRKQQPCLLKGDVKFYPSPDGTLLYERHYEDQSLLIALNFNSEETTVPVAVEVTPVAENLVVATGEWQTEGVKLPPNGVGFAWLAS